MAIEQKNIVFRVVTSSPARVGAFASLLGPERVEQIAPHFTEDVIRKPNNKRAIDWPIEMSERKALQDLAALMVLSYINHTVETGKIGDVKVDGKRVIRIYSDSINIAFVDDMSDETTMILEKPKNLARWMADREHGAMDLSDKNFEICTALTAIDMTDPTVHPTTLLIRIAGKHKPFTMEDVKAYVKKYGEENVLKSANGISFINEDTELFDTQYPLKVYAQTDPALPPTLLFELPTWDHLSQKDRSRILYGAIPEALDLLISRFTPSYPRSIDDGRK